MLFRWDGAWFQPDMKRFSSPRKRLTRLPDLSAPRFVRAAQLVVLGLALAVAANAQSVQVSLDPQKTLIDWTLGDVLHTVHGTFALKTGSIVFDPKTGAANGQIVIDARSGQSGNSTRDHKMQKDVLQSERYPEIAFLPKHVVGAYASQGSSNLQMQGVFRIHGGDHDFTIALAVQSEGSSLSATSEFSVPYEAWGMKNPSTLFLKVENAVQIKITAVGNVSSASAASGH